MKAFALLVLALLLTVPVMDATGVVDLATFMDNTGLAIFGFVWSTLLMLTVGELAVLRIRRLSGL